MIKHPYSNSNGNLFRVFTPCLDSTNLVEANLHPKERSVIEIIKSEWVAKNMLSEIARFCETQKFLLPSKDDPREKLLYLVADWDRYGSFDPTQAIRKYAEKYDLVYRVVRSRDEICNLIKDTTTVGRLAEIHLLAHNVPFSDAWERYKGIGYKWVKSRDGQLDTTYDKLPLTFGSSLLYCSENACYTTDDLLKKRDLARMLAQREDVKFPSDFPNVATAIMPESPEGNASGSLKLKTWNVLRDKNFSDCISNYQNYNSIPFTITPINIETDAVQSLKDELVRVVPIPDYPFMYGMPNI